MMAARTITQISFRACLHNKPPVGAKIKFRGEKQRYTVRAANTAYAVCTKPFNARKTVLYTIIDQVQKIRGTENLLFGFGAETDEECQEMLDRITNGETEVSYRNQVPLDIESITFEWEQYDKSAPKSTNDKEEQN